MIFGFDRLMLQMFDMLMYIQGTPGSYKSDSFSFPPFATVLPIKALFVFQIRKKSVKMFNRQTRHNSNALKIKSRFIFQYL